MFKVQQSENGNQKINDTIGRSYNDTIGRS